MFVGALEVLIRNLPSSLQKIIRMNVSATCLSILTHRMKLFDFMLVVASKLVYSDFKRVLGVLVAFIPSWGVCEREFSWAEFFPLFFVAFLFCFPFCVILSLTYLTSGEIVESKVGVSYTFVSNAGEKACVAILSVPFVDCVLYVLCCVPLFGLLPRFGVESFCLLFRGGMPWACLPFRQVLGKGRLF